MMELEAKDEAEFVLILSVGAERPVVRHVEEAHAFQAKKNVVLGEMEFPIKDCANGAELADKKRPDRDVGKRQTCVISPAARERRTSTNAFGMVPHRASEGFATILEVKSRGGESASEVDRVNG